MGDFSLDPTPLPTQQVMGTRLLDGLVARCLGQKWVLCGAVVARSAHNRESSGSNPERSEKSVWGIFRKPMTLSTQQ